MYLIINKVKNCQNKMIKKKKKKRYSILKIKESKNY